MSLPGSMAGYMGGAKGHIRMNGSGYDNKALHKSAPKPMMPKHGIIPPSFHSLKTMTMNRVHNYRLNKNPIAQDTWLSKLI